MGTAMLKVIATKSSRLKGVKFTDLVVPGDVDRVTQILETRGDGSAAAHHFRTNLYDSYDSKFCAEVFQVKFTMATGLQPCHCFYHFLSVS